MRAVFITTFSVLVIFNGIFFITANEGELSSSSASDPVCRPYIKPKTPSIFKMLQTPRTIKIPREETKFYLFTRENQNCFQELTINTLNISYLNPKWPTRIIIHGWMNNAFSGINRYIKDAYLTKGNFNVIIVDWGTLAKDINYDRASKLVDDISELVAEFINDLNRKASISYDDIYLIGHSLGAQIAGAAGQLLQQQNYQQINTIFALDPAEPNFQHSQNDSRISMLSAKYVESIHTDMGLLGIKYPVGHASFFPNYGKNQRGCGFLKKCSHARSHKYFAESINSVQGFWGIQCNTMKQIQKMRCLDKGNRGLMGGDPSIPKIGYYYVPINKKEPFAVGPSVHL